MNIYITARHFKAHETLRSYAFDALNRLEQFHDGIISADLVLSFEKSKNSVKIAELVVKVQGTVLKAVQKSEEFNRSIESAVVKMERQLQKHKTKTRGKDKTVIRKKREKE
ncbi:MAG: ribosome-associated translation inhibitor RaiA [Bacteroidetes bacterium]|nr:ribosome-associated translation inhibitor RaiA [Bacteroidota bacterium]